MPDYSDFMSVEEKGPFLPGTAFSFNYMAWLKGNAGKTGRGVRLDGWVWPEWFLAFSNSSGKGISRQRG